MSSLERNFLLGEEILGLTIGAAAGLQLFPEKNQTRRGIFPHGAAFPGNQAKFKRGGNSSDIVHSIWGSRGLAQEHLRTTCQGSRGGKQADREAETIMAMTRVHRLETQAHWQLQVLIIGFLFLYISLVAVLYISKKHEFTPFEQVKDNYLQMNPFEGHIIKSQFTDIKGKGVVIKLNTMCNSLIQEAPEFSYLVNSQNILGDLCAQNPSEVNFVAYIKYEKQLIAQPKKSNKVVYQLAKKVAVVQWPSKELVAQRTFTKNYPFSKNFADVNAEADRKLCVVSEEPSDEEVKRWIASLASGDYYYY